MSTTVDVNDFSASIERLFIKGIHCSTVIDVGCADGHFFLNLFSKGFIPGAVPFNIDANRLYEPSLQAIKDVVGGEYRISAITDSVGEIEITESTHPYWNSIRSEGDPYWTRVNNLVTTKARVPTTTLDTLLDKEIALKPPFLLKLDVQGAEYSALIGASRVLSNTHVVICEADIADFQRINEILAKSGFALYDLTCLSRVQDGTLGWFYPVYVNEKLNNWRPHAFWDARNNDEVVRLQLNRRESILKSNARILDLLKHRQIKTGRNEPCPCGSGRRFKHCCGRHAD
jgi:FkbM family methyltransferase